jgi:hypothetical protein
MIYQEELDVNFLRRVEPDEPALIAALETARSSLLRTEAEAATLVGNARAEVVKAQSVLDAYRRAVVEKHAQIWRLHAEDLRRQAEEAGDATVVVHTVRYGGPDGAVEEPQLRYQRVELRAQAAMADQTASHLEARLAAGDALAGESLEQLVTQLVPLPEADADLVAV